MSIPTGYSYLLNQDPLPRTIQEALRHLGVQEIVGKGSNATIMKWRDELNAAGVSGHNRHLHGVLRRNQVR